MLHTTSLRRRVTAAALAVTAALLLVLAAFVDLTLERRLRDDARARVVDAVSSVRPAALRADAEAALRTLVQQGYGVRVVGAGGAVLLDRGPQPPPLPAAGGRGVTVATGGRSVAAVRTLAGGTTITVTADTTSVTRAARQVRLLTAVGGAGVLAIGALVLNRVVGAALRPLDSMTRLARSITGGDRGRRLEPDRRDTELGRTAAAFDEMLDALETAERTAREAEAHARAAEQRMREFLSDAAHELRTPVAGVRAAAETLLREDPSAGQRERLAVAMVRESARAGRLVDDLLEMARLDRGLQLRLEPVELADLARHQTERLRLTAPDLQVHVTGTAPRVQADPQRVSQVLANLLDNARRATDGAGRVTVHVGASDGWALVDVADDGPGVPPTDRERVFDRFVRLDPARTSGAGGAGLGLPIARAIARAHGGDLTCEAADRGARFRLALPAGRPAQPST